jgi:DNA-binding CsgD family transcriptional regulator
MTMRTFQGEPKANGELALRPPFKCPNCGESAGECKDFRECAEIIAQKEDEYAREIAGLSDHTDSRPFHLLMAGFEALDLLSIGLAVTDAAGRLLFANRTTDRLLEVRDGLKLTSRGVIRTCGGSSLDLGEPMGKAAGSAGSGRPETKDAVYAVQRPSGKRPFTLLIRSVKARGLRRSPAGPAALVFILDPDLPVEVEESELRHLYGLTTTEARMANLLMEGKTLPECCDCLRIQRTTARTHLKHLFEKVGVQRQSELVSLLLKSIGLVRSERLPLSHLGSWQ